MSLNDITPLFSLSAPTDLEFRKGTVVTFNPTTGENQINIGGSIHDNISMLSITATPTLAEDDIVGLLRSRTQFFILGKIIVPPF
jgi:hypothetical protein